MAPQVLLPALVQVYTVNVSGYNRSDGTYVQPYTRSKQSSGASGTSSGTVNVSGYYRSDGTHVQPYTRSTPGSRSSASHSVSAKSESIIYADNPYNRRLGRVGEPLRTMPADGKRYVDNAHNKRLGRVGKLIPPRNALQRQLLDGNTLDRITELMKEINIGVDYEDYDDFQSTADRLAQQEVEEEWREKNIDIEEPPPLAVQNIPYEDLKIHDKVIGHGVFGTVFACLWKENPVAYKKFIQQQMSKRAREDFVKEIDILISLNHPNIVRLFGAVLEEERLGLVMEYMSRTLFQAVFIDESEFDDEKKKTIVSQLAGALQYLHTHPRQIAHCDIKSQNVLLDKYDNAKLSDFGLSLIKKNIESSQSIAAPVLAPRGTPRYSAPEVLRGELLTQQQYLKADIYSLAICVFEIVTEEEAFYGLNQRQMEAQVGKGDLRPQPESVALSPELSALLKLCWHSTADNRPSSTQFVDQWSKVKDLLA